MLGFPDGDSAVPQLDAEHFDVLTFDCYGTLIDWERGIVDYLQPVLLAHDAHVVDDFILECFAETETAVQAEGGRYEDVLRTVLRRFGTRLGFVPTDAELDGFPASLPSWPPFPDTLEALGRLAQRFELAVISNTDDALFARTNEVLGVEFAHVVTAERTGVYKPDPRAFETALDVIGARPASILHVAQSIYHDIAPASAMGLATVWIDRNGGGPGAAPDADAEPTWTFPTLGAFAEAVLA